ncbi:MAG TPA: YlmC/YmxH family sporulation protein [bacterium]|jgi:YlmC/YmxH family sporulation protein|nr:YlmC/YmxH family sporulation protein [bacterium]
MRLSQLENKELINLQDGCRIGYFGDVDLVFDGDSGHIIGLEISNRNKFLRLFGSKCGSLIPWQAIKKIGKEVIILDATAETNVDTYRDL